MTEAQDTLLDPAVEIQELRAEVSRLRERLRYAQAAANGTRKIRHQQSKTIEDQKASIIELERMVKKLGGSPSKADPAI